MRLRASQILQLVLERHVFRAFLAIIDAKAITFDLHVLAHVDGPHVVGVSGEEASLADFDATWPNVVILEYQTSAIRD